MSDYTAAGHMAKLRAASELYKDCGSDTERTSTPEFAEFLKEIHSVEFQTINANQASVVSLGEKSLRETLRAFSQVKMQSSINQVAGHES